MERTNLESRKSSKPKSRGLGKTLPRSSSPLKRPEWRWCLMAMVFTDAKGPDNPIIFANDSFLSLTGYDRKEVLGQRFNFLIARGTDPVVMTRVKAKFDGSSTRDLEIHYRRKDGSAFWAALFISPV